MVLINSQKTFDIINHKILLKKSVFCWIFSLLNCLISRFESYLYLPVFKRVSKVNSPMLQVPTAEKHNNLQGFPCWGCPSTSQKFSHSPLEKFPLLNSPPLPHPHPPDPTTTKFSFSVTTKG